jgi:hypothetical protein
MHKTILTLVAVLFAAVPAAAQYNALVYTVDGDAFECVFVRQDGFNITLRFGSENRVYNANDLAVVIFDNGFTNFYRDRDSHAMADPNYLVQKNGGVVIGMITSFVPDGTVVINRPGGGTFNLPAVDFARVYYNPRPFFEKAKITGNTTVEFAAADDGEDDNQGKGRGNGKNRDKANGKKPQVESLVGGEVFVRMKNGGTTRGIVYDVMSRDPELVFNDGRRIRLSEIDLINYAEVKFDYKEDKNRLRLGGATMIMRNGGVAYGVIIDYRGDGEWEFNDGRRIPWSQIARIYFR